MLVTHDYPDKATLDQALACFIADLIEKALLERGQATIALSGGKTPVGMLSYLAHFPLMWENVVMTLTDERWVEKNHPESNAYLLNQTLLQGPAATAHFIPLKNSATTPHLGQPRCEATLSQLPARLDIVVLGMGEDGHTASLFPLAPELEEAMQNPERCCAISPQTAPYLRMTLTAHYLAQSRAIILHITGNEKKRLLEEICAADALPPYRPIRRLLDIARTAKYVFWTS